MEKNYTLAENKVVYSITQDLIQSLKECEKQILDEANFAYSDFEEYKIECLNADPKYVEDELPADDFRYGMERAYEILHHEVTKLHKILEDLENKIAEEEKEINREKSIQVQRIIAEDREARALYEAYN